MKNIYLYNKNLIDDTLKTGLMKYINLLIRFNGVLIFLYILYSCSNNTKVNANISLNHNQFFKSKKFDLLIFKTYQNQIINITDTLYLGDTLKIKFNVPHYTDISIQTPNNNKNFFLTLDTLIIPDIINFNKQETLQIITNKTKSTPYVFGATERELIFNESGIYRLLISQNLETEGIYIETKKIVYYNYRKKSIALK